MLGNAVETVPKFLEATDIPAIGFISFDLDYYSSTAAALKVLDGPPRTRLPRVSLIHNIALSYVAMNNSI